MGDYLKFFKSCLRLPHAAVAASIRNLVFARPLESRVGGCSTIIWRRFVCEAAMRHLEIECELDPWKFIFEVSLPKIP